METEQLTAIAEETEGGDLQQAVDPEIGKGGETESEQAASTETEEVKEAAQNAEKGGEREPTEGEELSAEELRGRLTELYRRLAPRYGMTAEAMDHAALVAALDGELRSRRGTERIYADWLRQAEALAREKPGFDLKKEARQPEFLRLLRGGADLATAYRAAHFADELREAMALAAERSAGRAAALVAANAMRPKENGGAALPATRNDVGCLSDEELAEITRRVRNGERISFG